MHSLSIVLALLAVLLPVGAGRAQTDARAGRIIFPFAAGSAGDHLARLVAERLRADLGRPYIVENRTGGGGRIGIQAVKASPPDGSTLLIVPIAPMAIYPHFYPALEYDPVADFVPVSQVATFEFALAVAHNVPASSLAELVAWVKADPARGNYGSPSAGTLPHLFGIQFARLAGIDLRHVGYRGSGAAMVDLVSGHLPILITSTSDLAENHRSGRVRVLATTDRRRSTIVEGLPTFIEAGFDIHGRGWYAFYAPARTPADLVDRIARTIAASVQAPDARDRLLKSGLVATGTTPEQLAQAQRADLEYWGPIIRESGYKPDQ